MCVGGGGGGQVKVRCVCGEGGGGYHYLSQHGKALYVRQAILRCERGAAPGAR